MRELVLVKETNDRQSVMAARSTLDRYSYALAPQVGKLAPYLAQSRNREGGWIQCRLRSETLPLMQTLGRQCHPPRSDSHAACRLCDNPLARPRPPLSSAPAVRVATDAATMDPQPSLVCESANPPSPAGSVASPEVQIVAVEGVTHFLGECDAPAMRQLRERLCVRIREAVRQ